MDKKYGAPWQVAVGEGMFLEIFYYFICEYVQNTDIYCGTYVL